MKDLQEKKNPPMEDEALFDREFGEIASFVHKGFANAAPSEAVLRRIHEEATRATSRKRTFRLRIRILSAAASLAILAGGIFHFYPPKETEEALFVGSAQDFLDLQSLNEETCFNEEITLWE